MKKITYLLLLCAYFAVNAQTKSTGPITLSTNLNATLTLNNTTSTAVLSFTGPNDRWFALQFGEFFDGDGMSAGEDLVWWNNVTLVDARHSGVGVSPPADATNNWTLVSNNDNTPSTGLRTVVFSRPFVTGDANDYQFNFANTSIDFAWARRSSVGYGMNNHGGSNRGYSIDVPLTTLGIDDFSLNASSVFPNPTNGEFTVKTKTFLSQINVYSQTGAFVKTIEVSDDTDNVEVNIKGLQSGVYLLELVNDTEKSWKKVIVN